MSGTIKEKERQTFVILWPLTPLRSCHCDSLAVISWNLELHTLPALGFAFFFSYHSNGKEKKSGQLVTSGWRFANASHGFFIGCVFFPVWSERVCVVEFCLWSVCLDCLSLLTPMQA